MDKSPLVLFIGDKKQPFWLVRQEKKILLVAVRVFAITYVQRRLSLSKAKAVTRTDLASISLSASSRTTQATAT